MPGEAFIEGKPPEAPTADEQVIRELERYKKLEELKLRLVQEEERAFILGKEANGGTPPSGARVPIILLAGAIKWWWQATCLDCGHWDDAEIMKWQRCPAAGHTKNHNCYVWWDSPEFREYVLWRAQVRTALIEAGYLTYAPWMAFKGQWDERAQSINDAVIEVADAVVVLSPDYAITEGTDAERRWAERMGVPVIEAHPSEPGVQGRLQALTKLMATLGSLR